LKAVSSNESPGGMVRFLGGDDRGFLKKKNKNKRESRPIK
jgi:hypothetical protein